MENYIWNCPMFCWRTCARKCSHNIDITYRVIGPAESLNALAEGFSEDKEKAQHTRLLSFGESKRRCYLQLYFDPDRMARDRVEFDQELALYRQELTQERRVPEHEESYAGFFTWKRTPKRGLQVAFNWEAVTAARKQYVGFSAILTTKFKDPLMTLDIYREKDVVEKCFDDLKNALDLKRLRVHKSKRMSSRLFIQFIALILLSAIRQTMKNKLSGNRYSVQSLLWELESLTTIHYSGKYKNKRSEMTKAQRIILEAFEVDGELEHKINVQKMHMYLIIVLSRKIQKIIVWT